MHYYNKPFLQILSICTLFLLPIYKAASGEPSRQVNQMPINLVEVNEKIETLALEQQKTSKLVGTLQTGLNTAFQELNDLKIKENKVAGINAVARRAANGHGR